MVPITVSGACSRTGPLVRSSQALVYWASKFGRTTARKSAGRKVRKWWNSLAGPKPGRTPAGRLMTCCREIPILTSGYRRCAPHGSVSAHRSTDAHSAFSALVQPSPQGCGSTSRHPAKQQDSTAIGCIGTGAGQVRDRTGCGSLRWSIIPPHWPKRLIRCACVRAVHRAPPALSVLRTLQNSSPF